jgi:hypothetical protein
VVNPKSEIRTKSEIRNRKTLNNAATRVRGAIARTCIVRPCQYDTQDQGDGRPCKTSLRTWLTPLLSWTGRGEEGMRHLADVE